MNGGVRALFVLLFRFLKDGNLNLTENAEIKLSGKIVLAVLVRLLPQRADLLQSHFLPLLLMVCAYSTVLVQDTACIFPLACVLAVKIVAVFFWDRQIIEPKIGDELTPRLGKR